MQICKHPILNQVVREYSRLEGSFVRRKRWSEMSEDELWEELCICILSSNVPYELALSAFQHLREEGLLRREKIAANQSSAREIALELSKRIFWPKKKDGSYRKYRFPNLRAMNIVKAADVLYCRNGGLLLCLKHSTSEREARDFLAQNIPGIGLKEASHFLRNIGYSSSLAIIDTHVIAFLTEIGTIADGKTNTLTPSLYMKLEGILLDLCNSLGLNMAVFDMAIWQCMRGRSE